MHLLCVLIHISTSVCGKRTTYSGTKIQFIHLITFCCLLCNRCLTRVSCSEDVIGLHETHIVGCHVSVSTPHHWTLVIRDWQNCCKVLPSKMKPVLYFNESMCVMHPQLKTLLLSEEQDKSSGHQSVSNFSKHPANRQWAAQFHSSFAAVHDEAFREIPGSVFHLKTHHELPLMTNIRSTLSKWKERWTWRNPWLPAQIPSWRMLYSGTRTLLDGTTQVGLMTGFHLLIEYH